MSHEFISKKEVWVRVFAFKYYEVSSFGRVRSIDRLVQHDERIGRCRVYKGRMLKGRAANPGSKKKLYWMVGLRRNKRTYHRYVHRLVASAFLERPEGKVEVNHKDGNRLNNHVSNLEWVTHRENMTHSINSGLRKIFVTTSPDGVVHVTRNKKAKKETA